MAKFDEADPRWLVQERADGTNVNGWHWQERDMMEWSKSRLGELFSSLSLIEGGDVSLSVTGVDSVTGEAIINNRKQKIIPAYELEIKLNWEGTADGNAAKGKIHLPYVADENHDEDPELRFVCEAEDAASKKIKETFLSGQGKKTVVATIHKFVSELRSGASFGAKDPAAAASAPAAKPKVSSANPDDVKPSTSAPAAAKTSASKGKGRTLTITENFYCRAADLYDCFTNEGRVRAFTQSNATIEARVGGRFTWFGGSVQGEFTELEAGKKIAMNWRFSSWEDDSLSKVVLELNEPEPGHCVVKMVQSGIPEADRFHQEDCYDNTEKGWRTQIFLRIRQVFGYGLGL